ncbi:MAG: zinc ABC transporter substrate-binding protein [Anaerolineales bacterium]|nr:zinc ABC transporter substrate-binding protein [Anaerolineales bacterium]
MLKNTRSLFPWLCLTAGLLLAACQGAAPTPAASGRLTVVATFSILGDLVQRVAGDQVELLVLVGADGDAHSYEPAPTDTRALAEAGLIFENGLGFESWLDDLYAASGSTARRVVASEGLALVAADAPGEFDPHIWQSVPNARQMVKTIQAALADADPAHAGVYQANAEAYLKQLDELHAYILAQTASLPAERRKLVTNHDTFAYFAQAYGFTIVGDALGGSTTEGGEPSAAQMAQLADAIRAAGVPAIFAENVEGSQTVQRLAQETGVKLGPPLYTDALGRPGTPGETYLGLMRYNAEAIVGALR